VFVSGPFRKNGLDACAEIENLPAPHAVREKYCLFARTAESHTGEAGRKGQRKCKIRSERRGRRVFSQSQDIGAATECSSVRLGRYVSRVRKSEVILQSAIGTTPVSMVCFPHLIGPRTVTPFQGKSELALPLDHRLMAPVAITKKVPKFFALVHKVTRFVDL